MFNTNYKNVFQQYVTNIVLGGGGDTLTGTDTVKEASKEDDDRADSE